MEQKDINTDPFASNPFDVVENIEEALPELNSNVFENPTVEQPTAAPVEQIPEEPTANIPLINSYTPVGIDQNKIIAQVTPAKFDSLIKTLSVLINDKSSGNIFITKSQIIQAYADGAVVCINAKPIFDDKEVDFHILQPKKYMKQLKQFKGNNDIFIIDDNVGKKYVIDHGMLKVFLPKSDEEYASSVVAPDYNGCTIVDTIKIDKDSRTSITSLASDEGSAELLIHGGKLKGIYVKDTGQYTFEPYVNEPNVADLSETADLTLRTTALLPIIAEEYKVTIVKLANGSYNMQTELDTGFVKINIFESVQSTSDVNFEL